VGRGEVRFSASAVAHANGDGGRRCGEARAVEVGFTAAREHRGAVRVGRAERGAAAHPLGRAGGVRNTLPALAELHRVGIRCRHRGAGRARREPSVGHATRLNQRVFHSLLRESAASGGRAVGVSSTRTDARSEGGQGASATVNGLIIGSELRTHGERVESTARLVSCVSGCAGRGADAVRADTRGARHRASRTGRPSRKTRGRSRALEAGSSSSAAQEAVGADLPGRTHRRRSALPGLRRKGFATHHRVADVVADTREVAARLPRHPAGRASTVDGARVHRRSDIDRRRRVGLRDVVGRGDITRRRIVRGSHVVDARVGRHAGSAHGRARLHDAGLGRAARGVARGDARARDAREPVATRRRTGRGRRRVVAAAGGRGERVGEERASQPPEGRRSHRQRVSRRVKARKNCADRIEATFTGLTGAR
jgi:hypothetical protein